MTDSLLDVLKFLDNFLTDTDHSHLAFTGSIKPLKSVSWRFRLFKNSDFLLQSYHSHIEQSNRDKHFHTEKALIFDWLKTDEESQC